MPVEIIRTCTSLYCTGTGIYWHCRTVAAYLNCPCPRTQFRYLYHTSTVQVDYRLGTYCHSIVRLLVPGKVTDCVLRTAIGILVLSVSLILHSTRASIYLMYRTFSMAFLKHCTRTSTESTRTVRALYPVQVPYRYSVRTCIVLIPVMYL